MEPERCWCGGERDQAVCTESVYHDPLATGRPAQIRRLYLAGPMSGIAECNYPAFRAAAFQLRFRGYEVLDPSEKEDAARHYVDLLRQDLVEMMTRCDGVAVLENWWESTGARNEVQVAGLLKMPIRPVREWIDRAWLELR